MSKSSMDSVKVLVKEGWLLKRGEYIKNWRSRYMMLYSNGILYGYKCNPADTANNPGQEAEEPLNEFDLRHCSVKPSDKPSKSGFPFTIGFIQVSHYIQRHVSADSETARAEWIAAINSVRSNSSTLNNDSSLSSCDITSLTTSSTRPPSTQLYNSGQSGTSSHQVDPSAANNLSGGRHTTSPDKSQPIYPCYDDFDKLKVLGQGSFGKVMLVREKPTGDLMAMKILKKSTLVAKNEVSHTLTEKHVLQSVSHPFLTQLKYAFQDKFRLFFVMEYAHGGELFYHLGKERRFEEPKARFYAAEIVLGIGHLHKHNILYRDIKLENIMIDHEGHIKITDFGLCKKGIDDASTFCGTPEYLAPEVIALRQDFDFSVGDSGAGGESDEDVVYGRAVDWWALGIVLYEMLFGRLPFFGSSQLDSRASQNELYRKIRTSPLKFPQPRPSTQNPSRVISPVSDDAKAALLGFLEKDPNKRLGARPNPDGLNDIKTHPFFCPHIDWDALEAKEIAPPFVPEKEEEYFEKMFTDKPIELTPPERNSRFLGGHNELFREFDDH